MKQFLKIINLGSCNLLEYFLQIQQHHQVIIIKEDILGKVERTIPSMLNYKVHIGKDSMFNTPAVFPIYVSMLTLEWLKELGGIPFIEKVNEKKDKATTYIKDLDIEYIDLDEPNKSIEGIVMDELGLDRYCCRRMFLGNVHLITYI